MRNAVFFHGHILSCEISTYLTRVNFTKIVSVIEPLLKSYIRKATCLHPLTKERKSSRDEPQLSSVVKEKGTSISPGNGTSLKIFSIGTWIHMTSS